MKILIISDSHRHNEKLKLIAEKIGRVDMLIHCGDVECQMEYIREIVDCPVIAVRGNNDFFLPLEKEEIFNIEKYKVMLTHGHHYNVSLGIEMLVDEAESRFADIVMFGHTHRPLIEIRDNLTILNPGSISYPRQDGRQGTYIIMEIDRFGEAHYTLNYI